MTLLFTLTAFALMIWGAGKALAEIAGAVLGEKL